MLPRRFRLNVNEFRLQTGPQLKKTTPHIDLFLKKKEAQNSHFAFVVPKKLNKRTTRRNRTKRLLQEIIFHLSPRLKPGFWILIKAKRIIENPKNQGLYPEIEKVLQDVGALA